MPTVRAGVGIPCADPEEVLQPLGINARFRSYKYNAGFVYRPHFDGAWPGSGLNAEGQYVYDAYGDRRSRITLLIYLNDDFSGGHTTFFSLDDQSGTHSTTGGILGRRVKPVRGGIAMFPHGDASHVVHEGSNVNSGVKYIIRTEVLYSLPKPSLRDGAEHIESAVSEPSQKRRRK